MYYTTTERINCGRNVLGELPVLVCPLYLLNTMPAPALLTISEEWGLYIAREPPSLCHWPGQLEVPAVYLGLP